jgi:hypothetical protein
MPSGPRLLFALAALTALVCSVVMLIAPISGYAARPDRLIWLGGDWFAVGFNYPWHEYSFDFGADPTKDVHANYSQIDSQFADLQANGTHVTRWFVFGSAAQAPLFDAQGLVTGLPPSFFQDFDEALTIASAHNVYLIPVLLDSTITHAADGAPHRTVITDPTVRQTYLDRAVKPLLQRYANHPNILAWSIMNEPEWPAGLTNDPAYVRIPIATLQDFVRQNATYVHSYATQPATLDSGGLPWLANWTGVGLDLYLAHWYPWIDELAPGYSPYTRTAASFGLDKPIVITEFPSSATPYSMQQSLDVLYANGYAGALAWCFPNNVDVWCDYAGTKDALRVWSLAHLADVNVGPVPPSRTPTASVTPRPSLTATPPAATVTPTSAPATATHTAVPGGGSGSVLYGWETAGSGDGWQVGWDGVVADPVQSTRQAHQGTGSLRLPVSFGGGKWQDGGAVVFLTAPANWSALGTSLSAWVYLPADAPANKIVASIYAQHPDWDWHESPWVTLLPGQWTEISWPSASLTNVAALGVQVGGNYVYYDGSVYVDQLSVLVAASPTPTPSVTPTPTPQTSLTSTATATATGSATPTRPPAVTGTPTVILTATSTRPPATITPTATMPAGVVRYDWAAAGSTDGWRRHWPGAVGGVSQTASPAYLGSGALQLPLSFGESGWQDGAAVVFPSPPADWSGGGSHLSARVYLAPDGPTNKIGASLYVQHPNWDWQESPWVMLVPGQWVEVRWPDAPLTNLAAIGVQIGGDHVYYSGSAYLDRLAVVPTLDATSRALC